MENETMNFSVCPFFDKYYFKTQYTVTIILISLTLVGNALMTSLLMRQLKTLSRMHTFLLHLSIADFFVPLCHTLPELVLSFNNDRFPIPNDVACRATKFLQMFSIYASIYILVMCSIDRYFAVVYPLRNRRFRRKRVSSMVGLAWLFAGILASPQIFFFTFSPERNGICTTFISDTTFCIYATGIFIFAFLIPLLVIIFCYSVICYIVYQNFSRTRTYSKGTGFLSSRRLQSLFRRHYSRSRQNTPSSSFGRPNLASEKEEEQLHIQRFQMTPMETFDIFKASMLNLDAKKENSDSNSSTTGNEILSLERHQASPEGEKQGEHTAVDSIQSTSRNEGEGNKERQGVKRISKALLKTIRMTLTVCIIFVLCSTPFFIYNLWWAYNPAYFASHESRCTWSFFIFCLSLHLGGLNSCFNPLIYGCFTRPGCLTSRVRRPTPVTFISANGQRVTTAVQLPVSRRRRKQSRQRNQSRRLDQFINHPPQPIKCYSWTL